MCSIFKIYQIGVPCGTMIALAGSGLLTCNPNLGWPSVFFVSGASGIVWSLFWGLFGSTSPSTHSAISSSERDYICSKLPPENVKSEVSVKHLRREVTKNGVRYGFCRFYIYQS